MTRRDRKIMEDRANDLVESYDEAMINDLIELMKIELEGLALADIDEDLVEDIWINWKENLPEPGDWALGEAEGEYDSYVEDSYESLRELR